MGLLDTPLAQKLAPTLESSINLALSMDPGARKRLKPLQGCVFEINITSLKYSFFFGTEENKIKLLPPETPPSVTLSGSASALIKLALYKDKNILFKTRAVSLSGDAVRAQQIQTFMRTLKIDWEALLAEAIGDMPAHLLSSSLKTGFTWSKSLSLSFIRDAEEFIKYELRLLPSKAMAAKQFDAIDQLRLATDRLEARVKARIKTMTTTHSKRN